MCKEELNCHVCKSEKIGRCLSFGSPNYDRDVSVNNKPICADFIDGRNQKEDSVS